MKVFRYNTDLFLDYSLEYIDISSLDELKNYDIDNQYFIIIMKHKFLISFESIYKNHYLASKEELDKFIFNLIKYHEEDQTIFHHLMDIHEDSMEDHTNCYSI